MAPRGSLHHSRGGSHQPIYETSTSCSYTQKEKLIVLSMCNGPVTSTHGLSQSGAHAMMDDAHGISPQDVNLGKIESEAGMGIRLARVLSPPVHLPPRQLELPGLGYRYGMGKYSYMIGVSYDGTAYRGWQLQPGRPTIQAAMEHALSTALREPRERLKICAAGRTDAGVHATGQVRRGSLLTGRAYGLCTRVYVYV